MPFDAVSTKRGLLEELIKLAREARAKGLKDKLSPADALQAPDDAPDEVPEAPTEGPTRRRRRGS
jgi:hypothetical protein